MVENEEALRRIEQLIEYRRTNPDKHAVYTRLYSDLLNINLTHEQKTLIADKWNDVQVREDLLE